MTRCATCKNFTLKGQEHASLGLYRCPVMPIYTYPNPFVERECKDFREVPAEQMPARLAWEKGAR